MKDLKHGYWNRHWIKPWVIKNSPKSNQFLIIFAKRSRESFCGRIIWFVRNISIILIVKFGTWRRGWDRCEGRQWGQTLIQQSKQKTFFSLLRRFSWIPQLEKKVSAINPSSHAGFLATIIIISSSSSPSFTILDLSDKFRQNPDGKNPQFLKTLFWWKKKKKKP